jgi:hypothetical protein
MSVSGYFSDFSFPELLRFIHSACKTGVLQVKPIDRTKAQQHSYSFWFHDGNIVAVQHPSLSFHEWLMQSCKQTSEVLRAYAVSSVANREPIGTVLERLQLVEPKELQAIFSRQVITPTLYQFAVDDAWFKFSTSYELPYGEMTGLRMSPTEVALKGLRQLKNWKPWLTKLPKSTSSLRHIGNHIPYQLTNEEIRVWTHANGRYSLSDIAQKLALTVEEIQKIALRLIIAGLVDECPSVNALQETVSGITVPENDRRETVSASFLDNLLGFLKQRA